MKLNEIQPKQGNIEVEAVIVELGETRAYNKFGRELKVADAVIQDDSGTIKLTLWNDDIERFKAGDKIKFINGYANEFQGETSLTSGKFGKIEKLDGAEVSESVGDAAAVDESGAEMSMAETEVEQSTQENMNDEMIEQEKQASEEVKSDSEETEEVQDASEKTQEIKPEDLL
jgi:replication factor A1